MKIRQLTVLCGFCLLLIPNAQARVWYVKYAAPGNGSSWASAFGSISAAVNAASVGDEVWVAAGQYTPFTISTGIGVYGGFAGTETSRGARHLYSNVSIIDGGGSINSVSAVTISAPVTDPPAVLDGFTIRNGGGTFLAQVLCARDCIYLGSFSGGGVIVTRGAPLISHNTITSNNIDHAPGSPWNYLPGSGGGIYVQSGSPTIADNVISNNVVSSNDGVIGSAEGGGIAISQGSALVVNNTVVHNAASVGAAVSGTGLLVNNIIASNASHFPFIAGTWTMIANDLFRNVQDGILEYPIGTNGNVALDPAFNDPNGDYRLKDGSRLIDAGSDGFAPASGLDRWENPRLQGTHIDIGAFEAPGAFADIPMVTAVRVRPGGSDQSDGLSWATAKATVQAALDIAWAHGADVWVAAGNYVGGVTLRPYTRLYGGFAGTENFVQERSIAANPTILEVKSGTTTPIVSAGISTGACAIDGFTVRNGGASGIYAATSDITIANNHITGNAGGGIYISDDASDGACVVTANTISGNSTQYNGGGISIYGGNLIPYPSRVSRNTITGNQGVRGGGVYFYGANVTLESNLIAGNSAGGVDMAEGRTVNNTIVGNAGAGLFVRSGTLANNIVANNSSGIYLNDKTNTTLVSNDVFGNVDYGFADNTGHITIPGTLTADPVFVDAIHGDYHLKGASPCVDAGNDTYVTAGAHDLDGNLRKQGAHVDMGCYETQSPATITFLDVARALRLAGGMDMASTIDITRLDVVKSAPLEVGLRDAVRLGRKAVGLDY